MRASMMRNTRVHPDIRLPGRKSCMLLILVLIAGSILINACGPRVEEMGTLQGQVTIGPLVPALREGESEPTPSPEMYAERQVVISSADGDRELERVPINPDGSYNVTLPAGVYTVDFNRIGIDSADNLPAQIEIPAGEVVQLDISIDTGIR